jgi:transposase
MEIKVLAKQGHGIREIAREIGVSRNTVRRYLRDPRIESGKRQTTAGRVVKLHGYHSTIEQRVSAAAPHWIPATVIFREIVALGYSGGMTQLRRFVASLRPSKAPEPLIRCETAPGLQMQCDWVVFRRGAQPLSAFVATLGY